VSLKKKKSQSKAVEVSANSKEENSLDFCLDLFQEFGLCRTMLKSERGKPIENSAGTFHVGLISR
jgi:hypothetical protein